MKALDLSVIIISYNTCDITRACIESVMRSMKDSDLSYEIVVVDNDSQDGSAKMLLELNKHHDSILTLVLNSENIGFGRANNLGVQKASGTRVLLLNSDTIVLDHAIDKLHRFQTADPNRRFVGAKLLNADKSPQDSCGPLYSPFVVFVHLLLMGDRWPTGIRFTRTSPTTSKQVGWVSGACILCSKDDFMGLGGFDEKIFMYMEEIDLLKRAKEKGMQTYFYADARIIHLGSASSGGKRTFPILQVYTGLLYYYKKHYGKTSQSLLKTMLQLKALLGIVIGRLTGSTYLTQTYEKALALSQGR